MIKYRVFYNDIEMGMLAINDKGQHKFMPIEEPLSRIKDNKLFYELYEKTEWREPIPVFENRIKDARRFQQEKDIWSHTDRFRLLMV